MIDIHMVTLLVDIAVVIALVSYTLDGFRRGFVRTISSGLGLLIGGWLALHYGPRLLSRFGPDLPPIGLLVLLVAMMVVAAAIGQGLLGRLTRRLLPVPTSALGRVDGLLGAAVSLLLAATVGWLGAGMVRTAAPAPVVDVIDASPVLTALDEAAPIGRESVLDRVGSLFAQSEFPRVFEEASPEAHRPVEPPDPAIAGNAAITRAGRSVVRIDATVTRCSRMQEGSGFVVAPGLVVTNAHVVVGSSRVDIRKDRLRSRAEVVAFDPERDLAVLATDTADLTPLALADAPLRRGSEGAVAGYPLGGPYRAEPARVREAVIARGRDIYDEDPVRRSIYTLRSDIEHGNSGGPLLTTEGEVAGVVFARSYDDPSIGYALRPSELEPVLTAAEARQPVSVGSCTQD